MPSTSTDWRAGSTSRTWLKARTSRRCRGASSRSRKRLEVVLPSRGAAPPGAAASSATSRSRRAAKPVIADCSGRLAYRHLADAAGNALLVVEERAAHRVVARVDVALAEHDLEEMRAAVAGAEHVRAAVEVGPPDPPEALVEALGVERVDLVPVGVEPLRPGVEGEGVVPAQVLDVDHLEAAFIHRGDRLGEARDPPAREHVLADEELGVEHADVADEVQHAEPAGLQEVRVRLHYLAQLVAAGVLEHADRHHLVELRVHLPEVGEPDVDLVAHAAPRDLAAQPVHLLVRGIDGRAVDAIALDGVQHEAAETGADVDDALAGLQADLAADVLDLVRLRLLDRARPLLPVRTGVHQPVAVEPLFVEIVTVAVVKPGV